MPGLTDTSTTSDIMKRAAGMAEGWGGVTTSSVRYGVLSKERRQQLFGLDCTDQLEWRHWTPGTEYSKNYVIKNVSTNILNITYKQTASKAFSMDFPEPFKLRPGMSCPLKVIFRPLKLQQYSDHIEIFCNNSSFIVLVEAYTPATQIEVASQLDFGFVPNRETVVKPLVVKNTGDLQVGLSWKLDTPFDIEPQAASIPPGQAARFMVSFTPSEACSYNVNALCELDNGISTTVQILGISKFPYLSLEYSSVDFGSVLVGKTVERTFRFGNHSAVDANFKVEHSDGSQDGVFTITPLKGTLGPDEYTLMKVIYSPKHTGTFSSENFSISTAGGNRLSLNLRGSAVGPQVTFNTNSFNFGNVPAGQAPSRVLYIQNHSDVSVFFDFLIDAEDTFSLNRTRGVIAPLTTGHVTVTFRASQPANFWKRVPCLIKDADPLTLDLLATCYDEKSRPPPFANRHIDTYINRVTSGGAPVEIDPATISMPPSPVPSNTHSRPDSGHSNHDIAPASALVGPAPAMSDPQQPLAGPVSWQLLFEGQDPANAIQLDTSALDFGTCSRLSASEHKTVTVTNNTASKVTAFFSVPNWIDPSGAPSTAKTVFQVYPESSDIKPFTTAAFRIAFRPQKDGLHYSQTLHLRAFVKSMRNFRLVPDAFVIPPWSVPLLAYGNTFLHSNPEFAPQVELTHRTVAFPPCRPLDSVHQTIMIVNYGDTAVSYAFQTGPLAPHFAIKPAQGLVPAKGNVLVALMFSPKDDSPAYAKTLCSFNGVAMTAVPLELSGSAHTPRLTFDVPGALYFRPTCLGATSQRTLTVHNPSRVPIGFRWQLPAQVQGVLDVTPMSGVLRGNEGMQVVWTFSPAKQKEYKHKIPCMLFDPSDKNSVSEASEVQLTLPKASRGLTAQEEAGEGVLEDDEGVAAASSIALIKPQLDRVMLKVVGEGTAGALAIDPPSLDLGTLRVGHAIVQKVSLLNQSDGVLRYVVDCVPEPSGGDVPEDGSVEPGATPVEFPQHSIASIHPASPGLELWVDEPEGAIAAKASKIITVTFFPKFRKGYHLQLRCRTSSVTPLAATSAPPPRPASGGKSTVPPLRAMLPPLTRVVSGNGQTLGASAVLSPAPAALTYAAMDKLAPPAVCRLAADVVFPRLMVSDILLYSLPKQVVWEIMGIPALNHELEKQVTDLELELNKMEDKGSLTNEVAVRALHPFRLEFGSHHEFQRPCVVSMEIMNVTDIPVHWELYSSESIGLEMENWVEPGRPRNEEEKATDFIKEHGIFQLTPNSGTLEARGSRATITFTYTPSHVGMHVLPAFLRVHDGKRIQLQLRGETTRVHTPKLLMTPNSRVFTFEPTPIGETMPPLYTYLLRNGSPGDVGFTLDLSAVKRLTKENWGFEIIKLRSEASGTVPELGSAPLNWLFTPLEAKQYSVDVPVLLEDNSVEVFTLQGRGFHPNSPQIPPSLPGEGIRDWSKWQGFTTEPNVSPESPGRLLTLSHDVLSIGTMLPQAVNRHILLLTNTSEYPLLFEWDYGIYSSQTPVVAGSGSAIQAGINISPRSGQLPPGSQVLCRVTFEAGITPQLFEAEVKCNVSVDEEEAFRHAAEALREAEERAATEAVDYTDSGSVIEEIIYESPERRKRGAAAARSKAGVRPRLPIHLYMTTAIRARIKALDEQFSRTIEMLTQRQLLAGSIKTPVLPEPQVVALNITGRILTEAHIKAGYFIPVHELEAARLLLTGASWSNPSSTPAFWTPTRPEVQITELEGGETAEPSEVVCQTEEKPADALQEEEQSPGRAETEEKPADALQEEEQSPGRAETEIVNVEESAHKSALHELQQQEETDGYGRGEAQAGASQYEEKDVVSTGDAHGEASSIQYTESVQHEQEPVVVHSASSTSELSQRIPEGQVGHDITVDSNKEMNQAHREVESDRLPKQLFAAAWKPLPPPMRMDPVSSQKGNDAGEKLQGQAAERALAVLQGVLAEAMDPVKLSPMVNAWQSMRPGRVPAFAELREAAPTTLELDLSQACADEAQAGTAAAASVDGIKDSISSETEFQAFAEFVLESAVVGLVSESVTGDWQPPL